jgi:MFS transporter, BCD family, chlorophyll transporter
VQATCMGLAIALGGGLRDLVSGLATSGALGSVLVNAGTGYSFVYHVELGLLFATLIAIGPLARARSGFSRPGPQHKFGLAEFPG